MSTTHEQKVGTAATPEADVAPELRAKNLTPSDLDLTDPGAVIRELRKRVADYETLLRVIPIGISIAMDAECKHIVSNDHHATLLGHGPDENTSIDPRSTDPASFRVFRDGEEIGVDELPMHRAIAEKREILNVECDVVTSRGEHLTLIGHSAPLFDEHGNVRGAVGAFDNITQRKIAERKLAESERRHRRLAADNARLYEETQAALRLRDAFVATVSHELRSPLAAILMATAMLKRAPRTEENLTRALDVVERNARRQARLVEDLLEVSRIATGQLRLECHDVDFGAIVEDAVHTFAAIATTSQIDLVCEVPREPLVVHADPDRLHQVVSNLVSNAFKFAERGAVRISLERAGNEAVLRVSDDGRGIAPDFLPHVFEQFRQAPGDDALRGKGLGLGLSIVRHIVELHGGHVVAQSEGLGKGATFVVTLPTQAAPAVTP